LEEKHRAEYDSRCTECGIAALCGDSNQQAAHSAHDARENIEDLEENLTETEVNRRFVYRCSARTLITLQKCKGIPFANRDALCTSSDTSVPWHTELSRRTVE